MNSVGFASTYSLVDLLEELPLPKALNLRDNDRLATEPLNFQSVQELQSVAAVIAPAIQIARLPSDLDRLQFKDPSLAPLPNIRTHHAQATPLMSLIVAHYNQFQDIITVPPYNVPYYSGPQQAAQASSQSQPQPVQALPPSQPQTQPTPQPPPQSQLQMQPHPQPQTQMPPQPQLHPHPHQHTHPQPQPQPQPQQQPQQQPPQQPHPQPQLQPQSQHLTQPQPLPSQLQQQQQHAQQRQIPMHLQLQQQQQQLQQQQHHHQHQHQHPPQPPLQPQLHPHPAPQSQQHAAQIPAMQLMPPMSTTIPMVVPKPQLPPMPAAPTQHQSRTPRAQPIKRQKHEKREKRPEIVIDTKGASLEEVLEKFVQDSLNEMSHNFSPKQLLQLVAITAKLKKKNHTKNVNLNKLTSLMITLSSQLQVQTEVLKNSSYEDQDSFDNNDEGDSEKTRMQKFETCCDCSVTALNVMTSSGMDSRVYLEECVEAIINFINVALTIINDTATGGYCSSPKKSNKNGERKSTKRILFNKSSLSKLTAKCSEVLALVHDLLVCRTESTLNDSLVLSTSRAALTAFFLMDSSTSSNELQLNALNVITAIFAAYKNHQTVILEELIHSIARLPTTKRNRVQYQIGSNNNESISIFSALIMKLIQSLFTIRRQHLNEEKSQSSQNNPLRNDDSDGLEFERILKNQYNSALRASYAFVSSFLRRCCGVDKKDDNDYRVLFETFVEDLMTCLYKPDWSSAQLITHVLIKLLIANISPQLGKHQQTSKQSLKLASLDHLGTICARLVKEKSTLLFYKKEVKRALKAIDLSSVYSTQGNDFKSKRLRSKLIKKENMSESESDEGEEGQQENNVHEDVVTYASDECKILSKTDEQKFWLALLTFCQREKGVTKCGRNIFCAIWLKELERRAKSQYEANNPAGLESDSVSDDEESNGAQSFSGSRIKQYSRENNDEGQKTINGPPVEEIQSGLVREFFRLLNIASKKPVKSRYLDGNSEVHGSSITPESTDEDATIDEATASSIIKLLDVSLPTTQKLIDASLSHVVAALSTTANTNIRSKAMKSLSHVLNNAPQECAANLLARDDLQRAIGASLLDQSTSVRESTVELIGRFILNSRSEELIDRYYDMLTNRIMDSGVSVRKRVIKILREICITYPNYPRVPEICSIIIKRINDEGEGIRKLVSETFTQMWFKEEHTHEAIVVKVACITHVVATVWSKILAEVNKSTGAESHFEWLHQLLSSLLKVKTNSEDQNNHASKRRPKASESEPNEDGEVVPPEVVNVKQTLAASTQIIAVLMSEKLLNGSQESTSRADCLAAMTALWSFAKISPLLLTQYLDVFQSFLNVEPKSSFDLLILEKVIQIIELILPSISNPSASTMSSIETNLGKLIIRGGMRVVSVSVSCLSELIHHHTHNEQLANEMFMRFLSIIRSYRVNPAAFSAGRISHLLRALYTCGLLAKHFNIEERDTLYDGLVNFVETHIRNKQYESASQGVKQDEQILLRSLEGLGFMFERSPGLMLRDSSTRIYRHFMNKAIDLSPNHSAAASICVITNLRNYLQDEVTQEMKSANSIDWSRENLKEMTSSKQEDANSTQSSVIQLYLRDMLSCALSSDPEIRKASIKLIHGVHNGGHINPLSIIPSLIALSSDDDSTIRVRADHILQEIDRKYSNFVNMKSKQGVLESFILNRGKRGFHRLEIDKPTQGSTLETNNEQCSESSSSDQTVNITAKLSNLYSVVATNKPQRRAFINALLRYFDIQTLASAPNMLSNDHDEGKIVLSKCIKSDILLYVSDNLMFLPFTVLDEPVFVINQIGVSISNLVSQAVSQFREILQLSNAEDEEVEDDNHETDDLPVSILQVRDLVFCLHRCVILMHCKRVICELYGVTDQKLDDHTLNKDKPTQRRSFDETFTQTPQTTVHFDSTPFLESMYSEIFGFEDGLDLADQCAPNRQQLRLEYKRFSQMMTK